MEIAALSPPPLSPSFSLLSPVRSVFFHYSRPSISSPSLDSFSACRPIHQWRPKLQDILSRRPQPLRRVSGIDSSVTDGAQEIIPVADDGSGYSVVSALLFTAFIGLSLLTIGKMEERQTNLPLKNKNSNFYQPNVIYLAVQDFLQKREREKFEKVEAEKKKKEGKKKKKVRARAGPRGFGQKVEEDDDD